MTVGQIELFVVLGVVLVLLNARQLAALARSVRQRGHRGGSGTGAPG